MELKAIGRELQRDQRFKLYINSQDASHLVQYIEDMGNIPSKAGETHCDSSSLDAAFRVQCMISEQLLPQLYPLECCTAATVTSDALGHSKPTESNSALFYSRPFNLSVDLVPWDDMYYTLESDAQILSTVIENEMDELDANSKLMAINGNIYSQQVSQESTGTEVHESLKHMFKLINEEADPGSLKAIKKLLIDVRPTKSKWANDDRIGQEQLYESLEKVLNDLRNFTDHSLPFLKPVQKKEAPDYYDIIKKPMDLGTMAKKLKAQQYNSKEEFVTDLNLIWSNCMLYNTVPDSIYRRHASSMKRKAYELMKKVPDICVKSVPADDSDSEDAGSRIDGVDSIRTQSISGDFTPIVATNLSMLPFANVDLSANATDVSPSVQNTVDDLSSTDVSSRAEAEMLQKQMQREQDLADEEAENAWLQTKRWKDVTYKYRYSRLKFQETQLRIPFAERQAIIRTADGMRSFVESYRQFLLRNTERRRTVSERPELLQKFESDALIDDAEEVKLKREAFRRSFLPEIKHVYCAFPGLDPIPTNRPGDIEDFFRQRDDFESGSTTRQSMSEYKQYNPDYSSPLNIALINAIQELRSIKDVYYKIISKQSPSAINTLAEEYHATIPRVIPYTPVSNAQQLALFSINGESAFAALEKSVNLLVCHAGFDVISQSASTALTQIAMTFMNNMGKVLRLQLDDNDRDLTPETMLSALFSSNRLYDSIRLKQYIQGTLIKSQTKLADLRQKLEYALLEYDEWVDHLVSNGDIEFGMDHTADQIVSGNFFDDVGFDTLNLRELGFDFTHIPAKLWNMKAEKPIRSRLRRMVSQDEIEDDGDKISLESVPSVDAAKQAAAPKSFYEKMNMPIEQLAMEDIRTKIREEQQSLKQVSKRMLSAATEEPKKKQKAATASNVLEKEGASSSTPGAIVSPSSSVAGASAGDVEPPVKSEKQKKSSKGRSKAAKEKSKLSQSHVEK